MHTFMDNHLDMDIDDDWTQKAQMLTLATSATDHQKNIKTIIIAKECFTKYITIGRIVD